MAAEFLINTKTDAKFWIDNRDHICDKEFVLCYEDILERKLQASRFLPEDTIIPTSQKYYDTVEITEDEKVKINGSKIVENDIFYNTPQYESDTVYPLTLNSGEYFILGDQRGNAKDSRYFGAVKDKEIKGRVITVLRRSDI